MYRNKLTASGLTAWLVGAMVPTVIQLTAGDPWVEVLLTALLALLCGALCCRWAEPPKGKLLCLVQWGLLTLVLGSLCQRIPDAWPRGGHKAVAVILLGLALWSAWKGVHACAAVGSVLFWLTIPVYLVLLGAGLGQVQMKWLMPRQGEVDVLGTVLLLTPAAASIHLNKKEQYGPTLVLTAVLTALAAAWTSGVLSPALAGVAVNPFHEMIRSLGRLEAVASAGATLGWFSVLALYLSLCGRWAEGVRPGLEKKGMAAAGLAAFAMVVLELEIPRGLLLVSAGLCWVLLPVFTGFIHRIKKSK